MPIRKFIIVMLTSLLVLSACSGSIEKEQEKASDRAEEAFLAEGKKANKDFSHLSLYLPAGMDPEQSDENNILMTKGSKRYLLFMNPNEGPTSKVLYESTLNTAGEVRLHEGFEGEKDFGFILIYDIAEDIYEVTVGIGGIKMTTETGVSDLAHEAGMMMEIIRSIQFGESTSQ